MAALILCILLHLLQQRLRPPKTSQDEKMPQLYSSSSSSNSKLGALKASHLAFIRGRRHTEWNGGARLSCWP